MFFKSSKKKSNRGFTLVEVSVASALFGIVGLGLATVYLFSARSFAAIASYAELDSKNRIAMDTMTRELRASRRVMEVTTNTTGSIISINLLNNDGDSVTYSFDQQNHTLRRILGSPTRPTEIKQLVDNCTVLQFEVRQRTATTNSFDEYPLGGPSDSIQVINMTWKASKTIAGANFGTSEDVQTAHVVIRNQHYIQQNGDEVVF